MGALSAELIFTQAIMTEIGLSFLMHARADSCTARAVTTKQGASRRMKHTQVRFLFFQDLVSRKLQTMSAVKTNVSPSDVGTKALGRERVCRMRAVLGMSWQRPVHPEAGVTYHWLKLTTRRVESRRYAEQTHRVVARVRKCVGSFLS